MSTTNIIEKRWQIDSRAALNDSIREAGLPCDLGPVDWSTNPPSVRLDFGPDATDQQKQQTAQMAAAWDWSEAAQTRREAQNKLGIADALPHKLIAALALKASVLWTTQMTAQERNRVQQIINAAATTALAALRM